MEADVTVRTVAVFAHLGGPASSATKPAPRVHTVMVVPVSACARMEAPVTPSQDCVTAHQESRGHFVKTVVPGDFLGRTATNHATVPTAATATGYMEPACVTLGCMDASATSPVPGGLSVWAAHRSVSV